MVQLGDTFIWDPEGGNNNHLWIVLTRPDIATGQCVIINLTTSSGGSVSLTLKIGDHPYIRRNSDVNFGDAVIASAAKIEKALKYKFAIAREPMILTILRRIAEVAKTHSAPSRGVKKIIAAEWP